jgi:hypothetical protein
MTWHATTKEVFDAKNDQQKTARILHDPDRFLFLLLLLIFWLLTS